MFNLSATCGANNKQYAAWEAEAEEPRLTMLFLVSFPIRQQRKSHFQLPEDQLRANCLHKLPQSLMNESAVL